MKKWTIIIGIIFLILILQLSLLYRNFKENEVTHAEQAVDIARSEINFTSIESVEYYPGDDGHHVIIGENSKGEKTIVWVHEDHLWQERLSEGVSRERISSQLSNVQIKRLMPGMLTTDDGEKRPIWDAYYVTAEGEQLYEYFDFFTGESIKKIKLTE